MHHSNQIVLLMLLKFYLNYICNIPTYSLRVLCNTIVQFDKIKSPGR